MKNPVTNEWGDRIQQLQQQIETWQAMRSKLGGIDA